MREQQTGTRGVQANEWILLFSAIKRDRSDILLLGLSKLFISALLITAFFGIFPNILIASGSSANSLTTSNSATTQYSLQVGLIWFAIGAFLKLA